MKRWQNWLVPVLTFLTVLVLTILPRQASLIQDRQLTSGVHREELASDSNFPFLPPSLVERFDLLSRWYSALEYGDTGFWYDVTEIYQHVMESSEQPELWRQVTQELDNLIAAGVLPEEVPWNEGEISVFTRIYLRDTNSLAGASFLMTDLYNNWDGWSIQLLLDEESGRVLIMNVFCDVLGKLADGQGNAVDIGKSFLDYLGLEAELEESDNVYSLYSLEGSSRNFITFSTNHMIRLLSIPKEAPGVMDSGAGTDVAGSSMGQKPK